MLGDLGARRDLNIYGHIRFNCPVTIVDILWREGIPNSVKWLEGLPSRGRKLTVLEGGAHWANYCIIVIASTSEFYMIIP